MRLLRQALITAVRIIDALIVFPLIPAAWLLERVRRLGLRRLPLSRRVLSSLGILPVRHHYYEPFLTTADLRHPLSKPRSLPGIAWNDAGQLAFLDRLAHHAELPPTLSTPCRGRQFTIHNRSFGSGDAEYFYQLLRLVRPRRLIEIGSGYSTLLARLAFARNAADDPAYACSHICIEPYEVPWLEQIGAHVLRTRVERLPSSFWSDLGENDVLFIDSSHVIRPQGDVLYEYLEVLPALRPGVIVHVHDIFTPRDYPRAWVIEDRRLWNEQYLLEALISDNPSWRILGALNWLKHEHYARLKDKCPFLTPDREPGSFYLVRVGSPDHS